MFLFIIITLVIILIVWLLISHSKGKNQIIAGSEARGEKPFVFSKEKQFVASRKVNSSKPLQPNPSKIQLVKTDAPSIAKGNVDLLETDTFLPKTVEKKLNEPKLSSIIEKNLPQSKSQTVDFDHLEDLIEDFFTEEKDSKDFE